MTSQLEKDLTTIRHVIDYPNKREFYTPEVYEALDRLAKLARTGVILEDSVAGDGLDGFKALPEHQRQHLNSAIVKIRMIPAGRQTIELYTHEAEALYAEMCRTANYAALLGHPSPAEVAGIFTREECEAMAEARYGKDH